MASGETVDDVIRRIINFLDAASIPYMLTGSFASSLHGMPRAPQDDSESVRDETLRKPGGQ